MGILDIFKKGMKRDELMYLIDDYRRNNFVGQRDEIFSEMRFSLEKGVISNQEFKELFNILDRKKS